jgi:preprotein translocase subunit SecY
MAFCPNPDCPHKKKIGRPAEFRDGFTHCSDCGSPLSEEVIESKEAIDREESRKSTPKITSADLQKRILYTIALVFLYRVLLLIPVPGIDFQVLEGLFGHRGIFRELLSYGLALERFSLVALGVMPYLSAYMIVEILSLFIQPLKSWREEGVQGRKRIKEIAFFATFLLTLLQGYGLAQGLEEMDGSSLERVVLNPGLGFRLVSALTFSAGTFLAIWITELITKRGLGHGISILMFVGYGPRIFSNIPQIKLPSYGHNPFAYFLLSAIVVVSLIVLIILMEKSHRKIPVRFGDGTEVYIPLKFTSAGTMPAYWGSMLIGLPITILGFINHPAFQTLYVALLPGHIWYYIIYLVILFFLYYFFTSFFYNPNTMVTFLRNKNASILSPPGKNGESYIDRSLESMIPIAALYLCVVRLVPNAILGFFINFHLDGIGLIVEVAIVLDLIEGIRLSRGGHLIKLAELHDVPMAGLLKSLFEQKGIPCYLRGYYHRALLYFFGPYIEISVLVPEDRMNEAKEVIETYLDEKILTVRSPKALGV